VKVPFGRREVLGNVTNIVSESPHSNLRPILNVIGAQPLLTPNILKLARWISDYYCCPLEVTLKTALPDVVRKEEEGWRERLMVRRVSSTAEKPSLTKRQQEILEIIETTGEVFLQELLDQATQLPRRSANSKACTSSPSPPLFQSAIRMRMKSLSRPEALALNPEQIRAMESITAAMDKAESKTFLLHGVTGSGKTEVYLQAIAHALKNGEGAIVLVPEISLTPQTVERFKARFSSGTLQNARGRLAQPSFRRRTAR